MQVDTSPKNEGFVITQFHHTHWPAYASPPSGSLIEMLDMVTKTQISTGNRPITIMCKYVGGAGLGWISVWAGSGCGKC